MTAPAARWASKGLEAAHAAIKMIDFNREVEAYIDEEEEDDEDDSHYHED